jgi:hypothetical protein
MSTPLRVMRIALALNAVAAGCAAIGFAIGLAPHASENALLARRVAAGEAGGALLLLWVAVRLRRDPLSIAPAIAFLLCQVVDSASELVRSREARDLPPLLVESAFLLIYSVCATMRGRGEHALEHHA